VPILLVAVLVIVALFAVAKRLSPPPEKEPEDVEERW
jgi:hypothetical protein